MTPLVFAPTPFPHHASVLFWCTFAGMLAAAAVLNRLDRPRSVTAWMAVGYVAGLFGARGDVGGLAGAIAGLLLGLAAVRLSSRNR